LRELASSCWCGCCSCSGGCSGSSGGSCSGGSGCGSFLTFTDWTVGSLDIITTAVSTIKSTFSIVVAIITPSISFPLRELASSWCSISCCGCCSGGCGCSGGCSGGGCSGGSCSGCGSSCGSFLTFTDWTVGCLNIITTAVSSIESTFSIVVFIITPIISLPLRRSTSTGWGCSGSWWWSSSRSWWGSSTTTSRRCCWHTPIIASNLVVSCQVISCAAGRPSLRNTSIAHQTLTIAGTIVSTMNIGEIMRHAHIVTHLMSNNLSCWNSTFSFLIDGSFVSFPAVGSTKCSNPSQTNGTIKGGIFAHIDKEVSIGWASWSDVHDRTIKRSKIRFSFPCVSRVIGVITISLNLDLWSKSRVAEESLDMSEHRVQVGCSSCSRSQISIEGIIITNFDIHQVSLWQSCALSCSTTLFPCHFISKLSSIHHLITINKFPLFIISHLLRDFQGFSERFHALEGTFDLFHFTVLVEDEPVAPTSMFRVDSEFHPFSRTSSDSNTSFCINGQVTNEVAMHLLCHPIHFGHVMSFKN